MMLNRNLYAKLVSICFYIYVGVRVYDIESVWMQISFSFNNADIRLRA